MKNTAIARLACISFFGLTFVSPITDPNETTTSNNFQLPPYVKQSMLAISRLINNTEQKITSGINFVMTYDLNRKTSPLPDSVLVDSINLSMEQPDSTTSIIDTDLKINQKTIISTSLKTISFRSKKNIALTSILIHSRIKREIENTPIRPPEFYVDEESQSPVTKTASIIPIISSSQETGIKSYPEDLMQLQIEKLKEMSISKGYSNKYALMINLGMRSGKKRFHIVDIENNTIIHSGLVAHGKGKEKFTLNKTDSNQNGSSCSSLGLYKIGSSYNGSFGKSFRLIGLEKSNSNALSRAIVLHSMGCIPDEESDYPICQSEGCPSVSPNFLDVLSELIKTSKEPILLWMFDPVIDSKTSNN